MTIVINGEPHESQAANVLELWKEFTTGLEIEGPQGFAIALNGALVRKTQWQSTHVTQGDRIEIVRPMQGG